MLHTIKVYNCSQQTIPLQVKTPNGDFFRDEQQVRLLSGQDVELPKDCVMMDQITNLQAKGMVKITFDSESNID